MTERPKNLLYLHIPKCAGTSVKDWIKRNYDENEIFIHTEGHILEDEPIFDLRKKKVIIGHFKPYHRKIRTIELLDFKKNIAYGATVRNPLNQIASHINYVKNNPQHPAYFEDSIESAIARDAKIFRWQKNMQCSYFSRCRTFEGARKWIEKRNVIIHQVEETGLHISELAKIMGCENAEIRIHNKAKNSYEDILKNRTLRAFVDAFCNEDKKLYDYVGALTSAAGADGRPVSTSLQAPGRPTGQSQ